MNGTSRLKLSTSLLDFAVILQLLTAKKPSKILFILFTVNYCNMHCIVGICNEIYSNLLYMGICSILLFMQKQ